MDDERFEELSKTLATTVSRRQAVRIIGATAAGGFASLVGARGAFARQCRDVGSNCRSNAECCSRFCDTATFKCGPSCGPEQVVCEGQCVGPCPGGMVISPTTCQCVCPTGTEECNGECVPEGTCGAGCIGQVCFADNECCPESPVCCDLTQSGVPDQICTPCCIPVPCMSDADCACFEVLTGEPAFCELFSGLCLPIGGGAAQITLN